MKKSKRPLSPHIQIYKPQISSVLSITHRLANIILVGFFVFFVIWLTCVSLGEEYFRIITDLCTSVVGKFCMSLFILAYCYYLVNGIRHFFWDFGKGYSLKAINNGGMLVIFITFFIAGLLIKYIL